MFELFIDLLKVTKEVYLENPLAQIIGIIAYCVTIYTFSFCKDQKFLKMAGVFSGIWSIHFYLIAAPVAALVNFIDVFKNFYAIGHEKSFKSLSIFAGLYIIFGYIFYVDIYSLIPLCSSIIGLYLAFYARGIFLNAGYLIIITFWFVYNIKSNSIAGIASDVTLFFAGVYGILTMFILKKGKNTES